MVSATTSQVTAISRTPSHTGNDIEEDNVTDALELFDDAKEEFPAKEDLKDRLVAVWATGNHGLRPSAQPGGKSYPWVETITLVLDDGPDGTSVTELVGSTDPSSPVVLDGFQFSTGGMTARLIPRANAKNIKPIVGRINSRKNKTKGYSDSWSIAEPTDADRARALEFASKIREITATIQARHAGLDDDDNAFD